MTVLTITPEAWSIAGISPCVVFAILVLIVMVLVCDAAEGDDLVVVATALYLYLNSAHDEESGVLTIKNNQSSNWHAVLNPRL